MVYYSKQARLDLQLIFKGLLLWEKHPLEYQHALKYIDDLEFVCENLDKQSYHANTQFKAHRQYGNQVSKYKRNSRTIWYIIYNFDKLNKNVYIRKITSNYTLTETI